MLGRGQTRSKKQKFIIFSLAILAIIALLFFRFYLSNVFEHHKLMTEINKLQLSPAKPKEAVFDSNPTDSEQLFSSSNPGLWLRLPITQTTLGAETDAIEKALAQNKFTYSSSPDAPTNVSGTKGKYYLNVAIEYNGEQPPMVKTNQVSSFNGEPIFAQPGPDTKVNDLQIHLIDGSKTNF